MALMDLVNTYLRNFRVDGVPESGPYSTKKSEMREIFEAVVDFAAALSGTSATSLAISTGSKIFVTQADRQWTLGQRLRAASDDGTKIMEGEITAYSGTSLTIDVDYTEGAGTHADWNIGIAGPRGATGGTGVVGPSGTGAFTKVRAVATANVDIATALENGDSLDGVTLATNDLVLLTAQTDGAEDGVYIVAASGAASRHSDFDAYDDLPGTYFSVMEGTDKADTLWRCTSDRGGTLGTDDVTIAEASFGGGSAGRELLTANRTYYVRTDGSDSNDGLSDSAGGAFLTISAAKLAVYALDLNGFAVTIRVGGGTYTAGATFVGMPSGATAGAPITIIGDTTTPGNVIVSTTSANCFEATLGAFIRVQGMELRTTTTGDCLRATKGGQITYGSIRFGTCARFHKQANDTARIYNTGNYSIVGGAQAHEHFTNNSYILNISCTITISGTPAFSSYFIGGALNASAEWVSVTFSGSATGARHLVWKNASLDTDGTAVPGDSNHASTETEGGIVI